MPEQVRSVVDPPCNPQDPKDLPQSPWYQVPQDNPISSCVYALMASVGMINSGSSIDGTCSLPSHWCSVRFGSGEFGGQGEIVSSSSRSSGHFWAVLALCLSVLSTVLGLSQCLIGWFMSQTPVWMPGWLLRNDNCYLLHPCGCIVVVSWCIQHLCVCQTELKFLWSKNVRVLSAPCFDHQGPAVKQPVSYKDF